MKAGDVNINLKKHPPRRQYSVQRQPALILMRLMRISRCSDALYNGTFFYQCRTVKLSNCWLMDQHSSHNKTIHLKPTFGV